MCLDSEARQLFKAPAVHVLPTFGHCQHVEDGGYVAVCLETNFNLVVCHRSAPDENDR